MDDYSETLLKCTPFLLSLLENEQLDPSEIHNLRIESWRPVSARNRVLRQFVTLWSNGKPLYIAKIPLSVNDYKVKSEFEFLQSVKIENVLIPKPLLQVGTGFIMHYLLDADLPTVLSEAVHENRITIVESVIDSMCIFHEQFMVAKGEANVLDAVRNHVGDWLPSCEAARKSLIDCRVGGVHGDLGPWNIRYDQTTGKVGIIDWEDYLDCGIPELDVLNFIITLPLVIYPDFEQLGFDYIFDTSFCQYGHFSDLAITGLRRYARRINRHPLDILALTPVYCQAMKERIHRQGRSSANLFYGHFQRRFRLEEVVWASSLEDS